MLPSSRVKHFNNSIPHWRLLHSIYHSFNNNPCRHKAFSYTTDFSIRTGTTVISTSVEDAAVADADEAGMAVAAATNAIESTVEHTWVAIMARNVIIPCTGIKLMQPWKTAWAVIQKDAVHGGVG